MGRVPRRLKRRGLAGVKLVISDAHEGIKAAIARVFRASWHRCRVHFMRNALAHAGKSGRRVVAAFIAARKRGCQASDAIHQHWLAPRHQNTDLVISPRTNHRC